MCVGDSVVLSNVVALCLHRSSGTPRTAAVGAQSVSDGGMGITGADARILHPLQQGISVGGGGTWATGEDFFGFHRNYQRISRVEIPWAFGP